MEMIELKREEREEERDDILVLCFLGGGVRIEVETRVEIRLDQVQWR